MYVFTSAGMFGQTDSSLSAIFDFNEQNIKEKNNQIFPKAVGISLTEDRFGNRNSAIYLHGHPDSYLNLGSSYLLKPKKGTFSIWINLDRKIYTGCGSECNPIISAKNSIHEDFNCAYGIYFDLKTNKLGYNSHKDSTLSVNLNSIQQLSFNKWHHVAFTIGTDSFKFYVDGEIQQSAPKRFDINYISNDSILIGNTASIKNNRWSQGMFDDIQFFHRVLSSQEIKDLYNAPNPNKYKQLFADSIKYIITVIVLLIIVSIILYRNKQKLKKQQEQLELYNRISELELKVVKAQMNPHFVSNCLAAIQKLIYSNEIDKAAQYLAKFSYFLRQILNYSDKNFISLSKELEIIKLNVELEQLRFKYKVNFQLNIDPSLDCDEITIPALITQPFIENAIWHGLLPLNDIREPQLIIRAILENGHPVIEIEDNGIGRDLINLKKPDSKGTHLIYEKIDSLNKLSKTLHYKLTIIDLFDVHKKQIGTKVKIQLAQVS